MLGLKNLKDLNHKYIDALYRCLNGTENTPNRYHLEPNVGVHTEMVMAKVNELYKDDPDYKVLILGAALHDIGKIITRTPSKNNPEKIHFLNHENAGVFFALDVLHDLDLNLSKQEIIDIIKIVAHHDIYKFDLETLKKRYDYRDLKLLSKFSVVDALGRITEVTKELPDLNIEAYNRSNVDNRPVLEVLVGLPGSGKSTYVYMNDKAAISRDDILMRYGFKKYNQVEYSDIWRNLTDSDQKEIDSLFNDKFLRALQKNQNILIDKTNTSVKSRRRLFTASSLVKNYHKKAVVFLTPYTMILNRLEKRNTTGKVINKDVVDTMLKSFVMPTYDEFDSIEFRLWF